MPARVRRAKAGSLLPKTLVSLGMLSMWFDVVGWGSSCRSAFFWVDGVEEFAEDEKVVGN